MTRAAGTNGWYPLLVRSLPAMNLITALFWCINTSGLEGALKVIIVTKQPTVQPPPLFALALRRTKRNHTHGQAMMVPAAKAGWF